MYSRAVIEPRSTFTTQPLLKDDGLSPRTLLYYDLTDTRLGDVTLDFPTPAAFDRYRLYRTDFEAFQFVEYREALCEHRWKIHKYVG